MIALRITAAPEGQLSDEILAARVVRGDVSAFEILYDRYAPLVFGIAVKIIGDHVVAEHVLQETFWRVWKSTVTYQPEQESFTNWLFRMARSLAMDARGQQSTRL